MMKKLSDYARVLASSHQMTLQEASQFIEDFIAQIQIGLKEEKQVKVKGLGTFKITSVSSRESVDVNSGERIVIEGRDKISFAAESGLRERINAPFEQFSTVELSEGVDFSVITPDDSDVNDESDIAESDAILEDEDLPGAETLENEDETGVAVAENNVTEKEHVTENDKEPFDEQPTEEQENVSGESAEVSPLPTHSESVSGDKSDADAENAEPISGESLHADDFVSNDESGDMRESSGKTTGEDSVVADEEPEEAMETSGEIIDEEFLSDNDGTEEIAQQSEQQETEDTVVSGDESEVSIEEHSRKAQEPALETPVQESVAQESVEEMAEEPREEKRSVGKLIAFGLVILLIGGGIGYILGRQLSKHQIPGGAVTPSVSRQKEPNPVTTADGIEQTTDDVVSADSVNQLTAEAEKAADEEGGSNSWEGKAPSADKRNHDGKAAVAPSVMSQYEKDPRVRTGAYSIIGVEKTVEVKKGETLVSISDRYLGKGMECYVEAINGVAEVNAGQKLKIPKLILKKKLRQ